MRPGFGAAPANFTRPATDPVWPAGADWPEAEAAAGAGGPAGAGSPAGAEGAGGEPPQPASAQAAHRRQAAADHAARVLKAQPRCRAPRCAGGLPC
jgi:hypothetical protein